MMVKTAFMGATAFVVGVWATAVPGVPGPASRPIAKAEPGKTGPVTMADPPASRCLGGMTGPMEVEIVPETTSASPRGEVLRYSVRLRNRTDDPIRARHAVELVTDRGDEVAPPDIAPIFELAAADLRSESRSTPGGLADGFYILRVTAAVAAPSGDSTETVHMFLEVGGGRIYQMDLEEFYGRSHANEGVLQ